MKVLLRTPNLNGPTGAVKYQEVELVEFVNDNTDAVVRFSGGFELCCNANRIFELPIISQLTPFLVNEQL